MLCPLQKRFSEVVYKLVSFMSIRIHRRQLDEKKISVQQSNSSIIITYPKVYALSTISFWQLYSARLKFSPRQLLVTLDIWATVAPMSVSYFRSQGSQLS